MGVIEQYYVLGVKYGRRITYVKSFDNLVFEYTEDARKARRYSREEIDGMIQAYGPMLKYWYVHVDMDTGEVIRRYKP